MKLTKEQIDKVFEEKTDQGEALLAIYGLVFPDWERIKKVNGWPKCSDETWKYICRKFMELDRKYHSSMPGGLWMNQGFSSSPDERKLSFGEVDMEGCEVVYG